MNNDKHVLTNQKYWNSVWANEMLDFSLPESHFYFGRNGIFCKFINLHLGNISGKKVLEIGGGGLNKRLLCMSKFLGASVTALDYSEEGLSLVKGLFDCNQVEINLIQNDVLNWKPLAEYDIVVHWGVLEHFREPDIIIEKSLLALKPGGALLFSMPNMEAISSIFWKSWSPSNWSKHLLHNSTVIYSSLNKLGCHSASDFYFGLPSFKVTEWETRTIFQLPINLLQKLSSLTARVFPFYHRVGIRFLSMEHGFRVLK